MCIIKCPSVTQGPAWLSKGNVRGFYSWHQREWQYPHPLVLHCVGWGWSHMVQCPGHSTGRRTGLCTPGGNRNMAWNVRECLSYGNLQQNSNQASKTLRNCKKSLHVWKCRLRYFNCLFLQSDTNGKWGNGVKIAGISLSLKAHDIAQSSPSFICMFQWRD